MSDDPKKLLEEAHANLRKALRAAFREDTNIADVAGFAAHAAIDAAFLSAFKAGGVYVGQDAAYWAEHESKMPLPAWLPKEAKSDD